MRVLLLGCINIVFCNDKSFVFITASYNNKEWYQRNLDSAFNQTYDNWRMIYINDNSTDGTGDLVEEYIRNNQLEDKIQLINNKVRRGHLANQYYAIHSCNKKEIIVILDGDDWLAHNDVLYYLNDVYQDLNVWLTYGQFWYFKKNVKGFCRPIPAKVIQDNAIREHCEWYYSHLRSFYAGLFQSIKREDLFYKGNFFPMAADVATMYPMLEMCGGRFVCIPDVLYIYNDSNQLSFHHDQGDKQKEIRYDICHNRRRYTSLKKQPY